MKLMNITAHPGQIEYIDGNSDRVVKVLTASEVPEAARFAPTTKGLVPVTRVVATIAGDERTIREYGPDGQFLRSTIQIREG
jgi:hypothetical protein